MTRTACVSFLLTLCLPMQLYAQDRVYEAEEVKAAFIYHFATFVEWPQEAKQEPAFTIAVFNDDEVALELEQFLQGRSLQERPIDVQRVESLDEMGAAAVLFIGRRENHRLPRLIEKVRTRATLIVTDAPGALRDGSIINFQIVDDRVRFEVSLQAAERAGLELSSRLLAAALFVDTTSALGRPLDVILSEAGRYRGRL